MNKSDEMERKMEIMPKSDIAKIKVPTMEQHKRWGEELKYINNVLGHLCIDIGNNAGIKYGDELHKTIDQITKFKI